MTYCKDCSNADVPHECRLAQPETVAEPVVELVIQEIETIELNNIAESANETHSKSIKKFRSFWDLFNKVKNHGMQDMITKGNYIEDFVALVENMPEGQFKKIFLDEIPKDNTYRISEPIDCGCPKGSQCLCIQTKVIGTFSHFLDYLKSVKLDKYEVEIQHLRHLLKLQENSMPVKSGEALREEILERSDIEKILSDKDRIKEIRDSIKEKEDGNLQAVYPITISSFEDWKEQQKKKEAEMLKQAETNGSRPSLHELQEIRKKSAVAKDIALELKKELEFEKSHKEQIEDFVAKSSDLSMLKNAMKTIATYAEKIDTKVNAQQELKQANELFDRFDSLYADKQIAFIKSIDEMKKTTLDTGSPTKDQIIISMKLHREIEVMKKILMTAYEEFHNSDLNKSQKKSLYNNDREIDREILSEIDEIGKLFDQHGATKEQVEKEKARRKKLSQQTNDNSMIFDKLSNDDLLEVANSIVDIEKQKCSVKSEQNNSQDVLEAATKSMAYFQKSAEELQKFITNGHLKPDDLNALITEGFDPAVVSYWREKYENKIGLEMFDGYTIKSKNDSVKENLAQMAKKLRNTIIDSQKEILYFNNEEAKLKINQTIKKYNSGCEIFKKKYGEYPAEPIIFSKSESTDLMKNISIG